MNRDELINEPSDIDAPDWAKYKAQDRNGKWRWYQEKPQTYSRAWIFNGRYAYASKGRIPAGHDWRETLKEVKPMTTTPNAPTWPQLNPASSSLTDSQARQFAAESGTCSDGTQCGTFAETAYCDDCPNRLQPDYDSINPNHYRSGKVECIDALGAATINKRGIEAVCTANAIKYLWRYESKGGLEDVRKARWYLERLAKHLGE